MTHDRRTVPRQRVFVPIRLDGRADQQVGKVTSGVTRDVSAGGVLIRTRRKFTVGAPVTLSVQVDADGTTREVSGVVVRMGPNEADRGGLWPYEVAIRLDAPDAYLQAQAIAVGFVDAG